MNDDSSSPDASSFEFQQLLSDLSQGNLTEASSSRLSEMLHADASRCDALVQYMQMISVLESAEDGVFGRTGPLFEAVNLLGCELPVEPAAEAAEKIANCSAESLENTPSVLWRAWAVILNRIVAATLVAALFAGFALVALAASHPQPENVAERAAGKCGYVRPSDWGRVAELRSTTTGPARADAKCRRFASNERKEAAT